VSFKFFIAVRVSERTNGCTWDLQVAVDQSARAQPTDGSDKCWSVLVLPSLPRRCYSELLSTTWKR